LVGRRTCSALDNQTPPGYQPSPRAEGRKPATVFLPWPERAAHGNGGKVSTHAYEALVVGGGFYGCMIACHLRRRLSRVLLVEKHGPLLQRASYVNQARVHGGYHYPRSLLTGWRSRMHYDRFIREFAVCIDRSFTSYYAIGRRFSNVTAAQFQL